MSKFNRRLVVGLFAVVVVDLGTKLAAEHLTSTTGPVVAVRNAEFSLGVASAPFVSMVLLQGAVLAGVAVWLAGPVHRREVPAWAGVCLVGGGLANLIDRTVHGSVHDFIATPWIVFNVADVAVMAGLVGLAVGFHRHRWQQRRATRLVLAHDGGAPVSQLG